MGRAWVYGDNVDTDVIIPARYLTITDERELARHVLEDLDPDFATGVSVGDVVVAGRNFGCGSSREHAPVALRAAGVSAVVAGSFARIFFRNAVNTGLTVLTSPDAVRAISNGDEIAIEAESGTILNITRALSFPSEPVPEFVRDIVRAGGLVDWVREQAMETRP